MNNVGFKILNYFANFQLRGRTDPNILVKREYRRAQAVYSVVCVEFY